MTSLVYLIEAPMKPNLIYADNISLVSLIDAVKKRETSSGLMDNFYLTFLSLYKILELLDIYLFSISSSYISYRSSRIRKRVT